MKKIISSILAIMLGVTLIGCGDVTENANKTEGSATTQTAESTEKVVLTFWGHQEQTWNDSYEEMAKGFMEENEDIEIKFEFFPYDQFESKVQTSLISKEGGADIYELWGGWGIDFASTGALAEVPQAMADEIRNDAYEPTIGALEYDGKLYGMPMEFNIEMGGMLVNNALLEANNLTVPTTWEELITAAQKVTVKEGDICTTKGFDFVNWDSVPYLLTSMILSTGGQYLMEDGSVTFNTPEAKAAFEELERLVNKDVVTDLEGLTGGGEIEGFQQLFSGTTLFVPRGPWTVSDGVKTFDLVYGEDFQYAALPWYGSEKKFAAETGWSLAVNGNSKEKEAAFKFLEYFFQDEVLTQHNINCSQIPAKKTAVHSEALIEANPYVAPLVEILDQAQFIGYFNTDQFKEGINNAFVDYCSGIYKTAEEALKAATDNINANL